MKILVLSAILLAVLFLIGCIKARNNTSTLEPVRSVDLNRYAGSWFEIARYPHRFEKGCSAVKADYTLENDGTIRVINQCRLNAEGGRIKQAVGKAKIVDQQSKAKLKVSFFWPFYGDYWILKLDPDYQYAIVGEPSRKYVWILSRTPHMEQSLLDELFEDIRGFGYDPARLLLTDHSSI